MLRPEEVPGHIFSKQYVLENGVPDDTLCDEYYTDENGVYHYDRRFDKPMDEGGKPFSGLAYCIIESEYMGYTEYRDGYHYGADVWYNASGRPGRYWYIDDNENYIYTWHENGVLHEISENHRKDFPDYRRSREYDENGRLVKQSISCEISLTYEPDAPNLSFDVTWHDNGEFRLIRYKAPTNNTFYSEIELDETGYPIRAAVNPYYAPGFLSPEKYADYWKIREFGEGYCFSGDHLMYTNKDGLHYYSGKLCFRHAEGWIEKIMEFKRGLPYTGQYLYYSNGNLREEYCISHGKEYNKHIWWHPNGVIKKALIYSIDKKPMRTICFDKDGKVILDKIHSIALSDSSVSEYL